MIYLIMCGRLGNQLFQYAFAKSIQEKTGQELAIDFTAIENVHNDQWRDYLNDYGIVCYKKVGKNEYYPIQRFIYRFAKLLRPKRDEKKQFYYDELMAPVLNKFGVIYYESTHRFHKFYIPKTKNIIIRGWFESSLYFNDSINLIKKTFSYNKDVSQINIDNKKKLIKNPCICLTIRRGNFLNEDNVDKYLVCTKQYYYSAINYILDKEPGCSIYVCSDDIEWCKSNLMFDENVDVIYENDASFVEKLYLMSLCNHFVISNSTFSWWAQCLSCSENKIVVAPSRWNNDELSPIDIYEKEWIRMDSNGNKVRVNGENKL